MDPPDKLKGALKCEGCQKVPMFNLSLFSPQTPAFQIWYGMDCQIVMYLNLSADSRFLVPLAICSACAHKQPFFQLFNKSCANFLQILPRHGCYNLQASFAESKQAIVCTEMSRLQQLDFLKGLGTCTHFLGLRIVMYGCRLAVLPTACQLGQANKSF